MPKRIRWGVLGVAGIAVRKVIPAMQAGEWSEVTAIASRDEGRAKEAARTLGLAKAYGSYADLLKDSEIDAIYNPLPNHLHVPWSIRAAEAGKHVLCEKPLAMDLAEIHELIAARDRAGVKMGEAFMVRTHPQWLRAREIAHSGEIGALRAFIGAFSYFNADPANIRNVPEWGGGGMMDIGCYPIFTSRMIFGEEPRRVSGLVEYDPALGTDRLASAILDYPSGQAAFTCSMQLAPYQRVQIFGTKGRVDIGIPFNAPPDRPCKIVVDTKGDLFGEGARTEEFAVCDQYTIQGDLFSKAILDGGEVAVPLEDSLRTMAVIEAILRSGKTGRWEAPEV